MHASISDRRFTVARVLLWEFGRRAWWRLLLAQLVAVGVSAIVYSCLLRDGPLDPSAGRMLYFVLLLIGFVTDAGAVLATNGTPQRLYLLPLSNRAIASAVMLPGLVCAIALSAFTAGLLNVLYDVGWPIAGPAVCFGAAVVGLQGVSQLAGDRRLLRLAGWCAVAVSSAEWLRARYGGGWFLAPDAMWTTVTAAEWLTLLAALGGAFALFTYGIARERRNEPITWGMDAGQVWRSRSQPAMTWPRYLNAHSAQFFYEWRRKGWILPGTLVVVTLFLVAGYLQNSFTNGEYELLHGLLGYGVGLGPIAVATGLAIGHIDFPQSNVECGSFLATRPMTNAALSAAVLKTEVLSLLLTGGLLSVGLIATTGLLYADQGMEPVLDLWTDHGYFANALARLGALYPAWQVGGLLLSGWVALALTTTLVLTGWRPGILAIVAGGVPCTLLAFLLLELRAQGTIVVPVEIWRVIVGTATGLLTATLLLMALRQRVIDGRSLMAAMSGWLVLCGLASGVRWWIGGWSPSLLVMQCGLQGLVLAPFAAGPLAMSWNRHR
ncbi:MAG TPA: hypothetical protein VM165_00610 [Planctomycetaceae bacterium]|nr:hypothetical protein [Planctomycetaceae bacterium]